MTKLNVRIMTTQLAGVLAKEVALRKKAVASAAAVRGGQIKNRKRI